MLEHFSDAVRVVRFADGRPARLQAVVPREVTLGLCAPTADKLPDAAAAHANTNATAAATADAAADLLPTVAPPTDEDGPHSESVWPETVVLLVA